ncbi:MAG TPA: hypothetical protein VJT09_04445 [Pyrinomonadaceae bacterium]|nr:hypothetical protein [Pyrinomonadaceae bacterium]
MKSNGVVPRANTPKTVRPQIANGRPESIQRYSVLPPQRVLTAMPAMVGKREPDLPYAVIAGAGFLAQQSQPIRYGYDKGHDFLREPSIECQEALVIGSPLGKSLRLSDNGNMAIEDTDLLGRQPKEFYATSSIIRESNQALERVGAHVSLVQGAHALTIVTAQRQVIALYTVTPRFTKLPPQNCNAMAGIVGGWDPAWTNLKTGQGLKKVNEMLGYTDIYNSYNQSKTVTELQMEELQDKIASAYVVKSNDSQLTSKAQINQYASPGVGEAFMMVTLGKSTKIDAKTSKVFDYESRQERHLKWRYHFGGVVAVSGDDRITLENYARGDGRENDPDPRWYFQMYGGSSGQTFYDYNKATAGFSNPVATVVGK